MAVNPNSLKNLMPPPKKGEVRNPRGRKPQIPNLERLLGNVLGEKNAEGIEAGEAILMAMRQRAIKGDVRAAELLLDRAYGKPKQPIAVTNETVIVEFRDAE